MVWVVFRVPVNAIHLILWMSRVWHMICLWKRVEAGWRGIWTFALCTQLCICSWFRGLQIRESRAVGRHASRLQAV